MCGIAGCALKEGLAAPILLDSLKRLEYRGYDSVGHVTLDKGTLHIKKDRGKIAEVDRVLNLSDMPGRLGLAHTRWATHGAPSKENAHPQLDCTSRIAVVHNGIIENFLELRNEMEKHGHRFASRTDTEVVSHLIEEYLKERSDIVSAVRLAARRLKGSYAIGVISVADPDKIVCVRRESPLVVGVGDDGNYCASDIPALLSRTRRVIFLEESEMAIVTPRAVEIQTIEDGQLVSRDVFTVPWSMESAAKQGFQHFMAKEIHEQSYSIRNALRTNAIYLDLIATMLNKATRIFLIGCGTAYHACLVGSYLFTKLCKLQTRPVIASEFVEEFEGVVDEGTVIVAVSQSGETADTLTAVRAAKERGTGIISITNVMGSTLTRLSDIYIGQNSGPEIGVAATKTFTAQVAVLAQLAFTLAEKKGKMSKEEVDYLRSSLTKIPDLIDHVISKSELGVSKIADRYADAKSFCFLGRGINVATALEGRLKLLEISYLPAIAYPAGESKHGFIAVVEPGFPVVFIAPSDETHAKIIGNIMEMKARGAQIIAVAQDDDEQISALADDFIGIPSGVPPPLAPLLYVVPLQLLAYYLAVRLGKDPDQPRNLAKSVTVE